MGKVTENGIEKGKILHSIRKTVEDARIEKYDYAEYQMRKFPNEEELERQRSVKFPYEPLISVVTQISDVSTPYLGKMIESVLKQTYPLFELCIADNSIGDVASNIIARYITKHSNIRYVRTVSTNKKGMNLAEAFNMAMGGYILYVRPNDELTENALYEFVKAINLRDRVDVVYANEDRITTLGKYEKPIFKPNFNYDLLKTNNYIGFPLLVRRTLIKKVGFYNDNYDGAQEYDYVLRCVEGTDKICHVSKILYHSRNLGDCDDDADAMIGALSSHFSRVGIIANIQKMDAPGYFKIIYSMEATPHITVIVNDVSTEKQLKKCIDSIRSKTIYGQCDILIRKSNTRILRNQIEGTYVVALDSDNVVLSSYFIEKMIERMSQEDVAVVCGKVIDRQKRIVHAGVKLTKDGVKYMFKGMASWRYGYCQRAILQQNVEAFPMSGFMMRKDDYLRIDYLNLTDGVNVPFCKRLKENERIITFEPDVLFQKV